MSFKELENLLLEDNGSHYLAKVDMRKIQGGKFTTTGDTITCTQRPGIGSDDYEDCDVD